MTFDLCRRPFFIKGLTSLSRMAVALTLCTAVFGWASPAAAQGELQLGRSGTGSLTSSDPVMDDTSHYDIWTYRGKAAETIKVTLRSDAFDAYLTVGRMSEGEFDESESDDDGAGGTDSKLVMTLSEDGEYSIRVNSLSKGETGAYTVMVEQGDPSEVEADADGHEDEEMEPVEADPLPEPSQIRGDQTLNGELEDSDAKMEDKSHYDLYTFTARRGQQVTVTMRSTAFDSYLTLGRVEEGSFNTLESDDDGGGEDDAQISMTIPRDGEYAFRANSLFPSVTGAYSVQLEMRAATPVVVVPPQPIRYGQTASGELTARDPQMDDDTHYDLWKFTGKSGDKLTITMKSAAFDTYLAFGRMESGRFVPSESNDDGAGGTDSRIEVTLDADGEYAIRANSLFSKGLGAYTLNIVRAR